MEERVQVDDAARLTAVCESEGEARVLFTAAWLAGSSGYSEGDKTRFKQLAKMLDWQVDFGPVDELMPADTGRRDDVTHDETSGKYTPANPDEWRAVLDAAGIRGSASAAAWPSQETTRSFCDYAPGWRTEFDPALPPLRADGFEQAAVDRIKAEMLTGRK